MLVDVAVPVALAGAALLVIAGLPKLARPDDSARGLKSVGWPSGAPVVRALAGIEVIAGLAVLSGVTAMARIGLVAVALLYAGFTVFVLVALRRGGVVESCGCFGRADLPPTRSHAVATGLVAAGAAGMAWAAPIPWWSGPASSVLVTLLGTLLVGFLLWQIIAVLPTATAAAARSAGSARPRPPAHARTGAP